MRSRLSWFVASAALVAATAAQIPASAAVSATPPTWPSGTGTTVTVPLVTGDQVAIQPNGTGTSVVVLPAPGTQTAYESSQATDGDRYVVPAIAIPYIGRGLDRSLFDVSALARDGITGNARVPVTLTFAAGRTPTAPPGVTLTSISGNVAHGSLSASSGRQFAAALRGPLPGGLTNMSLDAAGAPQAARPGYPLHILQINVTDLTGQPASNVDVVLVNADDATKENVDVPIVNGVGRIAVPAGDYCTSAVFIDEGTQGFTAMRLVTRTDFTVPGISGTSGVTDESIDERTATSAVSASTPRPATEDVVGANVIRLDASGNPGFTLQAATATGGLGMYVNAQPAATTGKLLYVAQWGGTAPSASDGYRYDAAFSFDHIPADEHFSVRDSQIATVHQHFYTDPAAGAAQGSLLSGPVDQAANFFGILASGSSETMPGNLTQYLGTAAGGGWAQIDFTSNREFVSSDPRTFAAQGQYSLDWTHGPLAPTLGQHADAQTCDACTAGSTFSMAFPVFGDSKPDHAGTPLAPNITSHITLYRDGVTLADTTGLRAVATGVPAGPATYRAVLDTDLTAVPGFSQSTQTHTDLTVPYAPALTTTLPAEDDCAGQAAASPCEILPALTLDYQLATDELNTSGSAVQEMNLLAGHVSYDGAGSRAPITSAAVSVSFDGGATWHEAVVRGFGGHYTATWPNPAAARGTDPEIRVTATDAIGGSITQTITHAYTIAAPVSVAAVPASRGPVSGTTARSFDVRNACPAVAGQYRCYAIIRTDVHGGTGVRGAAAVAAGHPGDAALPAGYGPADLRSAYHLPSTGGAGQTIALVDAGGDPGAEADLDVYRATYGLPPCTTANGCFRKVNEQGSASPLPPELPGWGVEISLDLDLASAACPSCHILLVEASTPVPADLATAEDTAVSLGATVVSNSYGAPEQNGIQAYEAAYAHPGAAIVVASGDRGYGIPNAPAVYRSVIAVGGTTLSKAANPRGWTETAWNSGLGATASGCSAWISKPAWQHDPDCPGRMVADVAADADPRTGPAVYDANDGLGWTVVGGTSASAPFIAGVIGLAGQPALFPDASYLYSHASALNDVVGGNNVLGIGCGGDYLCDAVPGYDGPTGNGTPDGLGAF